MHEGNPNGHDDCYSLMSSSAARIVPPLLRPLLLLLACFASPAHAKSLVIGIVASPGMAMLKPNFPLTGNTSASLLSVEAGSATEWTGVDHNSKWELTGFAPDLIPSYTKQMGYDPR